MTEKRYSLIVVAASVVLAVGIAFVALGGGLFLGYQWGKSAGKAQAIEELPEIGARSVAPLLEQFFPRGDREGLIPPGLAPGGQPFEFGQSDRPYLGITFQVITPELREAQGLDEQHGALIVEVVPGSPADDAGLQADDIIRAVDGAAVNDDHALADLINSFKPGEQIELTVIRDGRRIMIEVELGTRPGGSSLDGDFLGRFLGQMAPGFQFQGELPEGFKLEYPCGDQTCQFPEDSGGSNGAEGFEG